MIYLDNASTTRCSEKSAQIVKDAMLEDFFNPSAKYTQALNATKKLSEARVRILKSLKARADEFNVVFTGSATEANNLVLTSSMSKHKENIVSVGEHASVYETAKTMRMNGYPVLEAPLNEFGEVDENAFLELLTPTTAFVSIMLVSNETGAINKIKRLSEIARKINPRILIHTDAVQAYGKIKINLSTLGVDYLTISSHKVEGPKGVGALVYRKKAKLNPQILGGGQEEGKRSGTENLPSILGFVNSVENLIENLEDNYNKVKDFKLKLIESIKTYSINEGLEFSINGNPMESSPYILSCGFKGTKGEVLLHALEAEGILVGTGSACNSRHSGNRILFAMGRDTGIIEGNIRLSFAPETIKFNFDEIAKTIVRLAKKHNHTK